jgi:ATP-dependent Clp protease, protease subunit
MFDVNTETGEIYLYDYIGPEWLGMIEAVSVKRALDSIKGPATLRINSGGGSVDEAIAIYGMLERHPGGVNVVIDSVAASAASFIALAGRKITIAQGGAMMIHSPMFGAIYYANATQLRKYADELDVHEERVMSYYAGRMKNRDRDEIKAMLAEETWLTAEQAIAEGLADEIGNPVVEPAAMSERMLKSAPESIRIAATAVAAGSRTKYPVSRLQNILRVQRAKNA